MFVYHIEEFIQSKSSAHLFLGFSLCLLLDIFISLH